MNRFFGLKVRRFIYFCDICRIKKQKENKMEFTAEQIAAFLQGEIVGNAQAAVHTFAKIEEGKEGALSFLANPHYEHYLYETQSTIVLVNKGFQPQQDVKATLIYVDDAYDAIAKLLTLYEQYKPKRTGIHPSAVIEPSATIGENCYVGPHAYIGKNVKLGNGCQIYANVVIEENATLGDDCLLYPNVSVYHDCKIGNRVTLHSGCSIGADGFGFAPTEHGYDKIPQIGIVTIEDDVEIGANACVDRSTMGSTYIRRGVKLDNLVQIAHNCDIGENTVMSAQVGVAGSAKVGQWCMFGGQVGINGHISIGDKVYAGAQSGLPKGVPSNSRVLGTPAIDALTFARSSVAYKKLPEMLNELYQLKAEIEELKSQNK